MIVGDVEALLTCNVSSVEEEGTQDVHYNKLHMLNM